MTNEQIRLFAAFFNIVAAGSMVAALVTEPFTWVLATTPRPWTQVGFAVIALCNSIVFHVAAQLALTRLRDDDL